jgi:hypothetical protein
VGPNDEYVEWANSSVIAPSVVVLVGEGASGDNLGYEVRAFETLETSIKVCVHVPENESLISEMEG